MFIEKAGTGGSLFRRLQTQFFTDLNEIVDHPAVAAAREAWYQVECTWLRLAQFAGNSAPPRNRHKGLIWIVAGLPGDERAALTQTDRAASALECSRFN